MSHRPRLVAFVSLAIALHGVVLAWAAFQWSEGGAPTLASLAGRPVKVRFVSEAVPAEQAVAPIASAVPMAEVAMAHAESAVAPEVASGQDGQAVDLEGYVPRRWLTIAPEAAAPILLPFPESFKDMARYTVILNLFIEADGRVGRVEFVGTELPEALARVARSTFERARFTPGQVNGRIVKSLIRIEVEFDNLGEGRGQSRP